MTSTTQGTRSEPLKDKLTRLVQVIAEAAERIDKLERALADERHHREENLRMGNEAMDHAERLMAERDTALRALAKARLDAERAKGALKSVRDCPTTTCGSCKAIIYSVLNVARQPEKDANNG